MRKIIFILLITLLLLGCGKDKDIQFYDDSIDYMLYMNEICQTHVSGESVGKIKNWYLIKNQFCSEKNKQIFNKIKDANSTLEEIVKSENSNLIESFLCSLKEANNLILENIEGRRKGECD